MKIRSLILTVILAFSLLLFASPYITSAFLITDTFRMRGEITGGGNINLTNFSAGVLQNISKIAVGQPIIGIANNTTANLKVCFGVLCTGVYQPLYSMNFTGGLNYSNGSVVANAPIKFTITYQTSQFVVTNWTNSSGYFFVKFSNMPDYLMKKDLNITIYVQSEIEAIYNCYYNFSLGKCCKQPLTNC